MTGLDDISQLYLVTEPVDFRKGIDGLGTYVQSILNTDPFQNAMFVFTNKRHNKLKLDTTSSSFSIMTVQGSGSFTSS